MRKDPMMKRIDKKIAEAKEEIDKATPYRPRKRNYNEQERLYGIDLPAYIIIKPRNKK